MQHPGPNGRARAAAGVAAARTTRRDAGTLRISYETMAIHSHIGQQLPPPLERAERARLSRGDAAAWEVAFRTHHAALHGFCLRLASGDDQLAADLVQETFLRTMARFRDEPVPEYLRQYLYTAARNLFFRHGELASRTVSASTGTDVSDGDGDGYGEGDLIGEGDAELVLHRVEFDPQRSALLDEQRDATREALAQLPDRQRQALAMCELEECSYAQVADALSMNENAVAQLLLRARTKLRLEMRLHQADTANMPAECVARLPQVSRLIDGQLKDADAVALREHLEGCAHCAQALEGFQEAGFRHRAWLPFLPLSTDDAWGKLASAATDSGALATRPDGIVRRLQQSLSHRRWRLRIALAIVMLLAVGGTAASLVTSDPPPTLDTKARQATRVEPAATTRTSGAARSTRKRTRPAQTSGDAPGRTGNPDTATDPEATPPGAGATDPVTGRQPPASGGAGGGSSTPPPPAPPPALPDLVVSSVSWSGNVLHITVANVGAGPSDASTVHGSVGTRSYHASVGALASGGTRSVSISTPCFEGNLALTATADAYSAVGESNESNNGRSGSVANVC